MTLHYPTAEQVAIAWLMTVPGVTPEKVATRLPADDTTWALTGFVTATTVGGSPASRYVPMREPILQIGCWAVNPGSAKPPWGKAGELAGRIVERTYTDLAPGEFTVRNGFLPVLLRSVWPLSEPRRITEDEAGYARYQFDLAFAYTVAVAA